MAKVPLINVLDYIRQLAGLPASPELTDRHLLERFAASHDEAAFATLVQRHGVLVWGVCRRILDQVEDAEDAFQATFLVLARKAGRVRWQRDVGNWLHAVAWRTARKARTDAARRRRQERQIPAMPATEPTPDASWPELEAVLDEELNRLPRKYRAPLVLHYLEGKTYAQAAQALGWPEGTVAARLARARQLLRRRLTRRGIGLSTGLLAALLTRNGAAGMVPSTLLDATVKAAALFAAGQAGMAGVISTKVVALTEGVLQAMFLSQVKMATALVLVLGTIGVGAGVLGYRGLAAVQGKGPEKAASRIASADADPPREDALKQEVERLKRENARLNQEVRQLRERIGALEDKLGSKAEASSQLLYQGKPISYWLKQLKDRDPGYRAKALEALGALAEEDKTLIPVLSASLKDRSPVGQIAANALAGVGKDAVPPLIQALNGQNPTARLSAVHGLAALGLDAKDAVPALIASLKDKVPGLRAEAAGALGAIGPAAKDAIPDLIQLLNDENRNVRDSAVRALMAFGPVAVPALTEALKSKADAIRAGAAESLCESLWRTTRSAAEKAVPALIAALGDRDPKVRIYANGALRNLGAAAVPALIGALKDKDPAIRAAAADTLAQIGTPVASPAVPALTKALTDENEAVRKAAARAFRRLVPDQKGQGPG